MATIRIQNFGPIKDTGLIQLSEIMLIIGRQSSGKSTFMKVLCHCRWVEKRIMTRIDNIVQVYTHNRRFATELKQFHRVDEMYFQDNTSMMEMLYLSASLVKTATPRLHAKTKLGEIDITQRLAISLLSETLSLLCAT